VPPELSTSEVFHQIQLAWQMGGRLMNEVSEDTTTFRMTGVAMYLDALLWKLSYLLESGVYKSEDLARVRRELKQSESRDSHNEARRWQIIREALFGKGHPYANESLSAKNLDRISTDDLKAFRAQHYRIRGATLIITGQFDSKLASAEIKRLFGAWPDQQAPPVPKVLPVGPQPATYFAASDADATQMGVVMAFATEPDFRLRAAARRVLREMVDEAVGLLRTKLGATYDVNVEHITNAGPGVLLITTSVDRSRAAEAFVAMRQAMEELRSGDMAEAFVRARRRVLHKLMAQTADSRAMAGRLSFAVANDLALNYHDDLAREVAALRPSDIRALMAAEMDAGREIVVLQGRASEISAVYQAAGIRDYRALR
jgi:predicted Zn-dependent peptidase